MFYERDNLIIGVWYSVPMIVAMFASLGAGYYCAKARRVRWIAVSAFMIFVAFFAGMATATSEDQSSS